VQHAGEGWGGDYHCCKSCDAEHSGYDCSNIVEGLSLSFVHPSSRGLGIVPNETVGHVGHGIGSTGTALLTSPVDGEGRGESNANGDNIGSDSPEVIKEIIAGVDGTNLTEGEADVKTFEKEGEGHSPGPTVIEGFVVHLHGINSFEKHARRLFETEYRDYFEGYYLGKNIEVQVMAKVTGAASKQVLRRGRGLEGMEKAQGRVTVTFTQITFTDIPSGINANEFIKEPFARKMDRNVFLEKLLAHKTFDGLYMVSHVNLPQEEKLNQANSMSALDEDEASLPWYGSRFAPLTLVIAGASGLLVTVLYAGVCLVQKKRRDSKHCRQWEKYPCSTPVSTLSSGASGSASPTITVQAVLGGADGAPDISVAPDQWNMSM